MGPPVRSIQGSRQGGGLKDDTIGTKLITIILTLSVTLNGFLLIPHVAPEPFDPARPVQIQREQDQQAQPIWTDHA